MFYNLSFNTQLIVVSFFMLEDIIMLDTATTFKLKNQLEIIYPTFNIKLSNNNIGMCKWFIINNISINVCDYIKNSNNVDILSLEIPRIISINFIKLHKFTMLDKYLTEIIKHNNITMFKNTLNDKIDLNSTDENGNTMLYYACKYNSEEIIKFLIQFGANPNFCNKYNYTPMMEAARLSSSSIIKLLIDAGGDITIINNYGYNAIHMAIIENNVTSLKTMIRLYLNYGKSININAKINTNHTGLMLAIDNDNIDIVDFMFCCGSSVDNSFIILNDKINEIISTNSFKLLNRCVYYNLIQNISHTAINISNIEYKICNNILFLRYALSKNWYEVVKLLIKHDTNIHDCNDNLQTVLHLAIKYKYTKLVKLFIDSGSNINHQDINKNTPLHLAIYYNHVGAVDLLIQNKAKLNLLNNYKYTPLYIACKKGYVNIFNLLINVENPRINIFNNLSDLEYNPIDIAIKNNFIPIVTKLILLESKINTQNLNNVLGIIYNNDTYNNMFNLLLDASSQNANDLPIDKDTALFFASMKNNLTLCTKFISMGANPNKQITYIPNINTALTRTIFNKSLKICNLFLKTGADPNFKNNDNESPLHIAVIKNNYLICQSLLINGADPNIKNIKNETPLHLSIIHYNFKTCKLLLNHGADQNLENYCKETPLHYACTYNNAEICNYLLINGADLHIINNYKETAIFNAINNKFDINIINMLLKKNININQINYYGETLLWKCVKYANYQLFKQLFNNIDVNVRNIYGKTIFDAVITYQNLNILELLITNTFNINILNNNGETILWHAIAFIDRDEYCCDNNDFDNIDYHNDIAEPFKTYYKIIIMLINAKINVNVINNNGESVIWYAVRKNNYNLVKILVIAKSDLNILNNENISLVEYAIANKYYVIANYLINVLDNRSLIY